MNPTPGKIILINGASSSGKSTLSKALQARLDAPFWHFSIDHIRDAGVLPLERIRKGEFSWSAMRPAFFDGFHRCLPALAEAGNNLIVEYVVESQSAMNILVELLSHLDVFIVGVHCPLAELERRELARGDRRAGDARKDHEIVHRFCGYDFEVNSTDPTGRNVGDLIHAWKARTHPTAFAQIRMGETRLTKSSKVSGAGSNSRKPPRRISSTARPR